MREKGGDVSLRVFANDKWLFTGQQGRCTHSIVWIDSLHSLGSQLTLNAGG